MVISIEEKVKKDFGYALQVDDIKEFEAKNGTIPTGSVVFVRSGWSKEWPHPALAKKAPFPGVGLDALKFLHLERKILFHGHEPLDTDATPTLEGEVWLMHNGFAQAEGVANLDQVPATGALVAIGFPKFAGGLRGYARAMSRSVRRIGNSACRSARWRKLPYPNPTSHCISTRRRECGSDSGDKGQSRSGLREWSGNLVPGQSFETLQLRLHRSASRIVELSGKFSCAAYRIQPLSQQTRVALLPTASLIDGDA